MQTVPLAAICCGLPVFDVQGAFVGCVEYVRTGDPTCPTTHETLAERLFHLGFVKVRRDGPRDRELLISADQIAYVADDHVRLSVRADDLTLSADHL
jgi:hypothetical protein